MSHKKSMQTQDHTETNNQITDPEVVATAKRRRFNAADKLRILEEAEQCTEPGQIGALLRREGLYSSHLSRWRKWRRRLQAKKSLPQNGSSVKDELVKLQLENTQLRNRLEQAELIIDVQKKLSQLLGLTQQMQKGENV